MSDELDSTLANLAEVVFACLDAARARSVAELGAESGLFTEELLAWGARSGAERIVAVEPLPDQRLNAVAGAHPELELVVATSHEALAALDLTDAVVIDGDHNYFTVSEELRLISERSGDGSFPLVLLHDVGWPHGRRDSYYAPERIPEEHRQPIYEGAFLVPGDPGVAAHGLFFERVAEREGGPANGVLTAVEDFVASDDGLALAIVPPFFGLGVLWHRTAPWADAVAEAVAPYDRNPLLERVERSRIAHLVAESVNELRIEALEHEVELLHGDRDALRAALEAARGADYDSRVQALRTLLPMHDSLAIKVGERVSRMKPGRPEPSVSREALADLISVLARDDIAIDDLRR